MNRVLSLSFEEIAQMNKIRERLLYEEKRYSFIEILLIIRYLSL
jgi:hypothetical protein